MIASVSQSRSHCLPSSAAALVTLRSHALRRPPATHSQPVYQPTDHQNDFSHISLCWSYRVDRHHLTAGPLYHFTSPLSCRVMCPSDVTLLIGGFGRRCVDTLLLTGGPSSRTRSTNTLLLLRHTRLGSPPDTASLSTSHYLPSPLYFSASALASSTSAVVVTVSRSPVAHSYMPHCTVGQLINSRPHSFDQPSLSPTSTSLHSSATNVGRHNRPLHCIQAGRRSRNWDSPNQRSEQALVSCE